MNESPPQQIPSIDTLFLDIPPSCIEFSHLHPEYFVIGTYQLQNPKQEEQGESQVETQSNEVTPTERFQERTGSVILCYIHDTQKIQIVDTCATEYAILDVHFAYDGNGDDRSQTSRFWTANSTGSIAEFEIVFSAGSSTGKPRIERRALCQLYPEDVLVLSFCWNANDADLMATTLSNGEVHVLRRESKGQDGGLIRWVESRQKPACHELEAWTSCFSASDGGDLVFSGGDDAVLQYTSTPTEFRSKQNQDDEDASQEPLPCRKLPRKFHDAGITALLPLTPTLLLTGSYDDQIRLLRLHPRPSILTSLNLSGGVWRLKLLSSSPNTSNDEKGVSKGGKGSHVILASCMHAGTRIVRLTMDELDGLGEEARFDVLATFEENESMNYGSDFQPRGKGGGKDMAGGFTVVSTSFYDRRVCLWRFRG